MTRVAPNSVELVGHYGGDETHALSAWTSTTRDVDEAKWERAPALLAMLASEGHHTPFEKSFLHFLVRCETASHIHLLKHRVAVSVNGESARYRQLRAPSVYVPGDWPAELQRELALFCGAASRRYDAALLALEPLLGRQRAKDSARFFLPYANQLTLDVAFNFRSFMHFVALRRDEHAQREIHDVAAQMLALVAETGDFDASLEAFGHGGD